MNSIRDKILSVVMTTALMFACTTSPHAAEINLEWTAPGDDGDVGTASVYDLRYATFPITALNWDSCQMVTGEPTPDTAGTPQSFTVTGLSNNTTYYFAIKTADEVFNWSLLSNVVMKTTPDVIVPAAILDLRIAP